MIKQGDVALVVVLRGLAEKDKKELSDAISEGYFPVVWPLVGGGAMVGWTGAIPFDEKDLEDSKHASLQSLNMRIIREQNGEDVIIDVCAIGYRP